MKAVIDTNILVDYLQGIAQAKEELAHYEGPIISLVTWMEIMIGAGTPEEERQLRSFLTHFEVHPITAVIAERAVVIRRGSRLRLPDAIIWATAQESSLILVTRNTRDFPVNHPGIRVPYQI